MGFTIFPKVAKNRATAAAAAAAVPAPAPAPARASDRDSGRKPAGDSKITDTHTITDAHMGNLPPSALAIQVDEDGGLGPSLENAALMFAHGNPAAATAALSHALDTDERKQPLVWMCLFDLLARGGERTLFDELALKFVVQFERSAPSWDELTGSRAVSAQSGVPNIAGKARSLFRGELSDPALPALTALMDASKQKVPTTKRFDVEINDLDTVSDTCGMLLAGALAGLRRKGVFISFRGLDGAIHRLGTPLKAGEKSHKGQWYLVLELIQWSGYSEKFEDKAVDFAVTFELSPPSWEPLSPQQRSIVVDAAKSDVAGETDSGADHIRWSGELKGPTDPCLKTLTVENITTNPVVIDMKLVQRIDFICGGAIANAFTRLMAQAIDVRVIGASPIIQALLQLTGSPATLFAKAR
jgi:anti-anti-sigma regulatory factor